MGNGDPESSSGRPRRVSDDDILHAVREVAREDRVATTSEVEDRVALSRRGVQKRLRDLHERGKIQSKEVGARGRVWWVEDSHLPDNEDNTE
ncbi:hypothetical protein [Halorussus marinus]|uniref:hypothetical protein n=1 Tax=Halorussus marinus TaxID=2505976 RepID=UPI001091CA5B|nr:hypothetical protein [Halorussus marinus]